MVFATPDGKPAEADLRVVHGTGFGALAARLMADERAREAYAALLVSREFQRPVRWDEIAAAEFDALLLPGGHAPGMRPCLESPLLQAAVVEAFRRGKPVAAICHGVVLAARSQGANGRSVHFGRKTTALLKTLEMGAWKLTCDTLGDYYRTYPETVEDEVTRLLATPADFIAGLPPMGRDQPDRLELGFTVRDGNYLSARWPGDAHRFAAEFATMLREAKTSG